MVLTMLHSLVSTKHVEIKQMLVKQLRSGDALKHNDIQKMSKEVQFEP